MPNTVLVLCPFYITHSSGRGQWQYTITCEDIRNNMGFVMRNQIRFIDDDEQKAYLDMFCCTYGYKECPYYKALYEKYHVKKEKKAFKIKPKKIHTNPGNSCEQISLFDISKSV
nr:MAG TPA: hypothetical protein [Bacteriophage sp.]